MEQGTEAIEAVKLAFEEEENTLMLVAHGVDMKSGRMYREAQKEFMAAMCKRVYDRISSTTDK